MEKPLIAMVSTLIGFVFMIVGFAGYVLSPKAGYQAVFVLGLLVLIGCYAFLTLRSRRSSKELASIEKDESLDGYVYYMDGMPEENDATIVDLTRR